MENVKEKEAQYACFETKDIPITEIYRNEMNFYCVDKIEELAANILLCGLKQNLEVVYAPCDKGNYRIVAGERRWRALKSLEAQGYKGFETATCKVLTELSVEEEQLELIVANTYRQKTVSELIEEENRLKKELERIKKSGKKKNGYDLEKGRLRDEIAKIMNMSNTKIAQIESIAKKLDKEWYEELKKENLSFSAAYELSGMPEEAQREMLKIYREKGELSYTEIKEFKEQKKKEEEQKQIEGQMSIEDIEAADYETAHPITITSICYSCTKYEECNVKTNVCTECDQYRNRKEANKTEEQKYEEEQEMIDKKTKEKLKKAAEQEKETKKPEKKQYPIRVGKTVFEEIESGIRSFDILKENTYKTGETILYLEFNEGRSTGRTMEKEIIYVLEAWTGLKEGYAAVGLK